MKELAEQLSVFKIDICGLQEMRWPGNGVIHQKKYTIFYSGNGTGKHEFGTGFYVAKRVADNVIDFKPYNERICMLRIKTKFYNVTLISAHAPTEDKLEETKEIFYNQLENVFDSTPKHDMKIVLGDFNAKVGKEAFLAPACGQHSLHDATNDNGKKMVEFAIGRDLTVGGTWFPHKNIHGAPQMAKYQTR